MVPQGRQHAETLRKLGVAADVPKAAFNAQLVVEVCPGQSFLCLEQLTPDLVLDSISVQSPRPRTFQTAPDLSVGARFTISDAIRVPYGKIENIFQRPVAMVKPVVIGPRHHPSEEHQPSRGI